MSKIQRVVARQVYDSRGNPTIEAEVYSKNLSASAICPSGASTGTYEAYELRDKDNKNYDGNSIKWKNNTVKRLNSTREIRRVGYLNILCSKNKSDSLDKN